MIRLALPLAFAACLLPAAAFAAELATPGPWPQWRGPNRDGISQEKGLLTEWPKEGPALLWQSEGLGKGFASLAISGDKFYTMGTLKDGTALICGRVSNGEVVWSTKVSGGEPNCTPTIDGERVYALGRDGDLLCADVESGDEIWRKNFAKDFGGRMMSGWGYSESPLIDGDHLICTPGSPDAILAALAKDTGEVVWKAPMPKDPGRRGGDGAAYSSPVISQAAGVKQYVQLVGRGVIGVRASDGKTLWNYNRVANGTANIPTPIVRGNYVFCSTGYGTGAALLEIKKGEGEELTAEEKYFFEGNVLQNHHGGMILVDDHVYFGNKHNNGFPVCVELLTGKVAWEPGRGPGDGSAAIVYADGHLYFRYENGVMALIEATPEKYNLKGSFKLAAVKGKSWPHPVVYDGKLYCRDQDVLMCYDIRREGN